jgi:hypothetical protein
MFLKRI